MSSDAISWSDDEAFQESMKRSIAVSRSVVEVLP